MKEEALIEALANPDKAAALDPVGLGLLLNALAAATCQAARSATVFVGPRSVRALRGRAWVEGSGRIPLSASIAAESAAEYGNKTHTVSSPHQGWKVQVSLADGELHIFWLEGPGVIALGTDNRRLGTCTQSAPSLSIPGITLPMNLTLRPLGTLD